MFKINKKNKMESLIRSFKKMVLERNLYITSLNNKYFHDKDNELKFTDDYCSILHGLSMKMLMFMEYINKMNYMPDDFGFDNYRIGHISNLINEHRITETWKILLRLYNENEYFLSSGAIRKLFKILKDVNSYLLEDKHHFELYNSYEYINDKYIFNINDDDGEMEYKNDLATHEKYIEHAKKVVGSGIEPYATSLKEILDIDIETIEKEQKIIVTKMKEKEKAIFHLENEIDNLIRDSSFFGFYVNIV